MEWPLTACLTRNNLCSMIQRVSCARARARLSQCLSNATIKGFDLDPPAANDAVISIITTKDCKIRIMRPLDRSV